MSSFRLTQKAKEDLRSIAHYTEKKWGKKQRNQYLIQLDKAFHTLSENHLMGRSCDEIREGYRLYDVGKHIIFYQAYNTDKIQIVRILHGRMSVEKNF